MSEYNNNFSYKHYISNFLLCFVPISFILGNLAINLNVILIILFSLFVFYNEKKKLNIIFFDKIISLFFLYIFLITIFKNYESFLVFQNNEAIIKLISYFRFLLLYFAIRILASKTLMNLKLFFFTCSICLIFVSLDLIYQYNFGEDIFGFEGGSRRLGGPFGDELVAGGYLQRFCFFVFFLFFSLNILKNLQPKIKFPLFCAISILISLGLIFAGNRFPFLIFFITAILISFIYKTGRVYFIFLFLTSSALLIFLVNSNLETKKHYTGFQTLAFSSLKPFSEDKIIDDKVINKIIKDKVRVEKAKKKVPGAIYDYTIEFNGKNYVLANAYIKDIYSGYLTWSTNKFFGGGLKSFRFNCPKVFVNCNIHPHNYYVEILTDLGLIGFFFILYIFSYVFYKGVLRKNIILYPFLIQFAAEIFPIKTSGSFFTTTNSVYIFLLISIIISVSFKKDLN